MTSYGSPWPMRALEELAADEPNAITDGPFGSKLKTAHYTETGPRVIRLANIGEGAFIEAKAHISESHFATLQKHRVFSGDLVIAALGENPPRSCIVPEFLGPAIVKADCIRFKPGPALLPKFANYALNSDFTRRKLRGIVHGVGRPRLNLKEIKAIEIPVPHVDEQQRIVAEIEKQFTRLDVAVAALKRMQSSLKRYRAAILAASFPTAPLPPSWNWTSPDQLARPEPNAICAGPFGTIFKAKDFRSTGVPIIFLRHVAPGKYLTAKPGFMDDAKWNELFKPYSVFGGELLITKLGEPPGTCAIYPADAGPAMVTPDVIKMSVNSDIVIPKFLMYYFNSERGRRFGAASAFGTTRLRLTIPIFRDMPVPLPPLAEQQRIVADVERRLSVVDELDQMATANLQRAKNLQQSILHRAFSGAFKNK